MTAAEREPVSTSRPTKGVQADQVDRELLELAAKAAKLAIGSPCERGGFYACQYNEFSRTYGPYRVWNPLTDDGDALRLAVKLGLQLDSDSPNEMACCWRVGGDGEPEEAAIMVERWASDSYAATRRAIVRAAASIGRQA